MQETVCRSYGWSVWTQLIFGLVLVRAAMRFATFWTNLDTGYDELALVAGDAGLLILMLGDAVPASAAWIGAAAMPWCVALAR